jgi:hypothetical protein
MSQRISAVPWALFLLSASTLLFAKALPYQDLPNHLASLSVLEHADIYPEFVGTGLFKTNSAIFALLRLARTLGLDWTHASKIAAAFVFALSAVSFCRLLNRLASKQTLLACAPFLLPLVHGWFLEMGMLDYALAIPLVCECILATEDLSQNNSQRALGKALLFSLLAYYAHVFALCIFVMLALLEGWRRTGAPGFRKMCLSVGAAALLCTGTLAAHVLESRAGASFHYRAFLPPWENMYNAWAECAAGYTKLGASSILIVVPLIVVLRQRSFSTPWFRAPALVTLALFTFFGPYIVTAWFYVANRFAPFFWLAVLANVRIAWPKWTYPVWLLGTLSFWASLCFDTHRLSAEHERMRAASSAIPLRARLLPLMMQPKGKSEHTRHLLQAWGYYVLERQTSAPLLFAHSKMFPVVTRTLVPEQLNHLALERIAMHGDTPESACAEWGPLDGSCEKRFTETWQQFWREVAPEFDYILMQGPPSARVLGFAQGDEVLRTPDLVLLRVRTP